MSAALLGLLAGLWATACGSTGSDSRASGASGGSAGSAIEVNGLEHFGWLQVSDSIGAYNFAVYIDNVRTELPGAICHAADAARTYECESPLPPMSAGLHVLEVVAWFEVNGRIIESPRAPALRVLMTTSTLTSTATTSHAAQAPSASGAQLGPPAEGSAGCGFAVRSERELISWNAAGDIRVIDRELRTSRPILWSGTAGDRWTLAGIAVDPRFAETRWVYLIEILNDTELASLRVSRYREVADVLGERATVFGTPLSTLPGRVSVGFDPDGELSIALLARPRPDRSGSENSDKPFVIRVSESGKPPSTAIGGSPFDRATAIAPLAVGWTNDSRLPWIIEQRRAETYLVRLATRGSDPRFQYESHVVPIALHVVSTPKHRKLLIVDASGEVMMLDAAGAGWTMRARAKTVTADGPILDAIVFDDGDVVACGSSARGGYGVWRGRAPL
jgi:hypothetical protein